MPDQREADLTIYLYRERDLQASNENPERFETVTGFKNVFIMSVLPNKKERVMALINSFKRSSKMREQNYR